MKRWAELDIETQAVCLHESGHGLLSEALDWRVKYLKLQDDGGWCKLIGKAPSPLVDLVVSAAGHAAERSWFSAVVGVGSWPDRECAAAALELAGLEPWQSPLAVDEIEQRMWPLFESDDVIANTVERIARELARSRFVGRCEFLKLAEPALTRSTRLQVGRFCRRLVLDVFSKCLKEVEV